MTIARSGPTGPISAIYGQVTFDAASCAAATATPQAVTIPGALPGDIVLLIPPAAGMGVGVTPGIGFVSAANTAQVPFINPTAGALDPASLVYDYVLIRKTG